MTPAHLGDVLREAAATHGDTGAFVQASADGGRQRLTFGAWDAAADAVALALADRGVRRGDVVCLLLPPSIDYAVAYLAAARLGAVTSGVNLRLGVDERASILARLRPTVTVVDDVTPGGAGVDLGPAGGAGVDLGTVVSRSVLAPVAAGAVADAAAGRAVGRPPAVPLGPDDPVAVVWTSGSTGVPKGALFRQSALAAVAAGSDVLSHVGDRRLAPIPFAHVGYMTRPWDEISHRVTTVITPQPWSAAAAIDLMSSERCTVGQGVPTQWALVLAHPDLDAADLGGLRIAATGGARVPPELVRAMRLRLGCPVVVRYTSTETSLGTGTVPGDADDVVATTVGRPVPGVELALADESGAPTPPGAVGRVRLRSAAVMAGYVGTGTTVDGPATAAVLDDAGWVTTGDLGWLGADGNLRLVGRAGDMYIRGGYNVYPTEVEGVLGGHPAVDQVAVVGAPDPVLGEVGVAFVVVADGAGPPDLAELRELVATRLADYKAPDRLEVVPELPVTAMGKIDKRQLQRRAEAPAPVPAGEE